MTSQFFDPDDFDSTPTAKPISAPVDAQPVTVVASEKPKFFELKPLGSSAFNDSLAPQPLTSEVESYRVPEGIKMPERLEIPTEFPSFQAPEGYHVDLSDLPLDTEEPMTRRQLREMEKLTGSDFAVERSANSGRAN
jgi:hypothetical protein